MYTIGQIWKILIFCNFIPGKGKSNLQYKYNFKTIPDFPTHMNTSYLSLVFKIDSKKITSKRGTIILDYKFQWYENHSKVDIWKWK